MQLSAVLLFAVIPRSVAIQGSSVLIPKGLNATTPEISNKERKHLFAKRFTHDFEEGLLPDLHLKKDLNNLNLLERQETSKEAKDYVFSGICGLAIFLLAASMHWFNEERSAKMDVLLSTGLEECTSVDADSALIENRGRLVHVQGRTCGKIPLADPQFQDAAISNCLKLQSTVEVLEWVPSCMSVQTAQNDKDGKSVPRFHTEWTTTHHESARFRQPSPKNPRLPGGIILGTTTSICDHVELGRFSLSTDMLSHFRGYEPAMERLPDMVQTCGITFYANPKDGFFYGRPWLRPSATAKAEVLGRHQEGDLRVRFMCVPDCDATVVAVQCHKDGQDTFVPYRVVARGPCTNESQDRIKLVEEGEKPYKDYIRHDRCMTGGVATCCCCPCNTVACFTSQEVVTEEIFYISDSLEPAEKPFKQAVQRNPLRVWNLRLAGWLLTYLSMGLLFRPFGDALAVLSVFGRFATRVMLAMIALSSWTLIVGAAYVSYRPSMALKCCFGLGIIVGVPIAWDRLSMGS